MWKTLQKAFKVKEVRDKLIYTFLMLVVIRIGSQLPVPGVKTTFFAELFKTVQRCLWVFQHNHGRFLYEHVHLCTEHYPVHHFLDYHAASDHRHSETGGDAEGG